MTHATKEAAAVRAETGATWPVGAKQEDFLRLPQSGCGLNDELQVKRPGQAPCGGSSRHKAPGSPEWLKRREQGPALCRMEPEGSVGARPPDRTGLGGRDSALGLVYGSGSRLRRGTTLLGAIWQSLRTFLVLPTWQGRQGATGI